MNQFQIDPNPYDVLEISPEASDKEITIAFTLAMKRRKYSAKQIAQARKNLIDPQSRIIADYLRPIIDPVRDFETSDLSALDEPVPSLEFITEFNNLEAEIAFGSEDISPSDLRLGKNLFSDN